MSQSLLLNLEDFLRITNKSDVVIEGRYDGKDYTWEPGEYLDVHKVVATHVFGWLDPAYEYEPKVAKEIRERAFLRLGWVSGPRGLDMKHALNQLKQVSIEPVPPFPNVRLLRAKDPSGLDDNFRMPSMEVLPEGEQADESAPRVAPGTPMGGGADDPKPATAKDLRPEDPQANNYTPRVQQNTLHLPKKQGK
jgi:hypothetical protein